MPKLCTFDVTHNWLEMLPKQFFKNCKSLDQIFLDRNRIMNLDEDTFKGLSNLTIIHIMGNQITKIRSKTFANFPSLKVLSLNNNPFELEKSSDIFKGLTNLENLSLTGINISDLSSDIFKDLISLKTISLAITPLKRIKAEYFANNINLEQLFFTNSTLIEIEETLIDNKKNLTILDLEYNVCINKAYGDKSVPHPEILNFTVREEIKKDLQKNCKLGFK
jgi:insulin-like growth factor-binding protein complex acid labile subunit